MKTLAEDIRSTVVEAHRNWGWYLALGIVLVLTGIYCIYAQEVATVASVVTIGAVLFIAGLVQTFSAFMSRGAGHVILLLLVGVLDAIVGVMLMNHPEAGALVLTLAIAALLTFTGVYRLIVALVLQFPNYGWVALSAAITALLGVLLWMQWPVSGVWFIGFAVGINLLFAGASWSTIAFKLKDVPGV